MISASAQARLLACGFLGLLAYVYTFGHGTPCTTYDHYWLGSSITYGIVALSVIVVIDMVVDGASAIYLRFWRRA